jgi:hypothetical protein
MAEKRSAFRRRCTEWAECAALFRHTPGKGELLKASVRHSCLIIADSSAHASTKVYAGTLITLVNQSRKKPAM